MKLSLVVPCYNEAFRGTGSTNLTSRLKFLRDELTQYGDSIEVIFSDDCSTDNSVDIINLFISDNGLKNWRVITAEENGGKGSAIMRGFEVASGEYMGFMDADLSTHMNFLHTIFHKLSSDTCYIASRYTKGSIIMNKRPFKRRVLSRGCRIATKLLFHLWVSDTQCGFKVFPADFIRRNLCYMFPSRWLLDIELLLLARSHLLVIKEVPVIWSNNEKQSSISVSKTSQGVLIDLIKIWSLEDRGWT